MKGYAKLEDDLEAALACDKCLVEVRSNNVRYYDEQVGDDAQLFASRILASRRLANASDPSIHIKVCKETHSVDAQDSSLPRWCQESLCERYAARCVVGHDCPRAATMPSSRLLHPRFGITTLSLCSGPRHIAAPWLQRYRSNDPKRGHSTPTGQRPKREDILKSLRFPRKGADIPTFPKIVWAIVHIPQFLNTLKFHVKEYLLGRMPVPPESEGFETKSRVGRFVYNFLTQELVLSSLNRTIEPWGYLGKCLGGSMLPSIPASPGIVYCFYAYFEKQDIKVGDVVTIAGPNYDNDGKFLCKRVAALEGDIVRVRGTQGRSQKTYQVRLFLCHQSP